MSGKNLTDQSMRSYLQRLEESGGMVRIDKEVDPAENLAALDWKIYDEQGKGSLFTNIKGHPGWQACSQVLADRDKWSMALNLTEDEIPGSVGERLRTPITPIVTEATDAPCKEVILRGDDASLFDIPVVTQSEQDGRPFIPAGMAIIRDPDTGIRNMSIHRMQVFDSKNAGFIMIPRQARRIYDKYVAGAKTCRSPSLSARTRRSSSARLLPRHSASTSSLWLVACWAMPCGW